MKVTIHVHVDDYHDTRQTEVADEAALAWLKSSLGQVWGVSPERIREQRTPEGVTLTIDE